VLVDAPFNQITGEVIAAAIEVHRILGPGLLESTYMPCLQYELSARKLRYVTQQPLPLVYKGMVSYLNLSNRPVGLLINFNVPKLVLGVGRLINKSWRPS
jgi:hypothetical protein